MQPKIAVRGVQRHGYAECFMVLRNWLDIMAAKILPWCKPRTSYTPLVQQGRLSAMSVPPVDVSLQGKNTWFHWKQHQNHLQIYWYVV